MTVKELRDFIHEIEHKIIWTNWIYWKNSCYSMKGQKKKNSIISNLVNRKIEN